MQILPKLDLNHGDVHLWFTFPDQIKDPSLLKSYHDLMNEEDKKKCYRYMFEKDRHTCLVTRALVRTVLSRYTEKPPTAWQFDKNEHGRPEIVPDDNTPGLRFNLAHTQGLIACAVALDNDVGVDVENLVRKKVDLKIADRFFSAAEANEMRSQPENTQKDRFFDYWTLKESLTKAWGRGLALNLGKFTFTIIDRHLDISFDSSLNTYPEDWQFYLLRPTDEHKAAVAIHKGELAGFQLSIKTTVPLKSEQSFSCEILGES